MYWHFMGVLWLYLLLLCRMKLYGAWGRNSERNRVAVHGHERCMEESPYAIPSRKFTMWLFIISDAVTFGAFLMVYGYLRVGAPNWVRPFESGSVDQCGDHDHCADHQQLDDAGAVDASKAGRQIQSDALSLLHDGAWEPFSRCCTSVSGLNLFHRGISLSSGLFGQTFFTHHRACTCCT